MMWSEGQEKSVLRGTLDAVLKLGARRLKGMEVVSLQPVDREQLE